MDKIKERVRLYRENPRYPEANGTTKGFNCLTCKDEGGWLVRLPQEQTVQGEQVSFVMDHWHSCDCISKRLEEERVNAKLKSSQITFAFRKKTFDSFDLADLEEIVRTAFRRARVYYSRFSEIRKDAENGICLLGRPGCGKTHLLMAVTNALMDDGHEVLYFPYVESMEEIKNDMTKEDVNKIRFERLKSVPVLFIDDLFKPPTIPSAYEIRKIFEVINHRYLEQLPVLISSEHSIDRLCDFDEGLGSRINEMCSQFIVELQGDRSMNYRLREKG